MTGRKRRSALLQPRAVLVDFDFDDNMESVLKLLQKYVDVPMSLADVTITVPTRYLTGLRWIALTTRWD
jgi:hypothetical protein